MNKQWSREDEIWLINNYKLMKIHELSKYLGRTIPSINNKLIKLNCAKSIDKKHWTQKDINYLTDNYKKISIKTIAQTLHRSKKQVYCKLYAIKHCIGNGRKRGGEEENQKLLILYNENKNLNEIKEILGLSINSIRTKLRKYHISSYKERSTKLRFRSKNFYSSIKQAMQNGTVGSECCLCRYNLCIDLHHIDGNRENNTKENISSLCPNHHREIERGMHKDKKLYCVWWKINSDGSLGEKFDNNLNSRSCIIQ
jgi:DNA-binding transcriptional regulator GbsR (MarR family)